jgi:hypothetical protein
MLAAHTRLYLADGMPSPTSRIRVVRSPQVIDFIGPGPEGRHYTRGRGLAAWAVILGGGWAGN